MTIERVLIYDGDCHFCQLSLDFGIRHLAIFPKYVAFQKVNPSNFLLSESDVRSQIWLVPENSNDFKPLGGHLAAAEILIMQKNVLLKLAGWLMKTPPTSYLAKVGYRWIAKNRHRLPGGTKQCKIEDTYLGG